MHVPHSTSHLQLIKTALWSNAILLLGNMQLFAPNGINNKYRASRPVGSGALDQKWANFAKGQIVAIFDFACFHETQKQLQTVSKGIRMAVCQSNFLSGNWLSFHFYLMNEFLWSGLNHSGFLGGSDKESTCSAGHTGSIPESGRSPGEGNDCPTPVFLPGESRG